MNNENKQQTINTELIDGLNSLLSSIDLTDISANSSDFDTVPDGYYLSEVEEAKLTTSKSSGQLMVAFRFKISENGYELSVDDSGNTTFKEISGTNNRKLFVYYSLKDSSSVKRFVKDMLKFEGDEEGQPILDKEYFTTYEVLNDALNILIGMRIYIQVSTTINKNDNTKSTWQNLISWERAKALELPR